MSPEMLQADTRNPVTITEKTDVYSFGILLWEMLTKKKAFSHHSMHGNFKLFRQAVLVGERPPIPSNCDPFLRQLLQTCWDLSPDDRPSFKSIVEELTHIVKRYKIQELQEEIAQDIDDGVATSFWFDAFASETNIAWSEFSSALCQRLYGVDGNRGVNELTQMQCLKEILLGKYNDTVSRKNFGQLVNWFGPLTFSCDDGDNSFLNRLTMTMQLPYFHGFLGDKAAESLLTKQSTVESSFLLRIPDRCARGLCLSRMNAQTKEIQHLSIGRSNGMFICEGVEYSRMSDIVDSLILARDSENLTCVKSSKVSSKSCTQGTFVENIQEDSLGLSWDDYAR